MQTIEIIGFKRANLGKTSSTQLRIDGFVPSVIYGGEEQVHFYAPVYLYRNLVYTKEAKIVIINVEGTIYRAIMQDLQFHPVSEMILHVDFLQIFEEKEVKINIPVRITGTSPGVQKGGKLAIKQPYLKVQAIPANLPDYIDIDVTGLDLGQSARVSGIKPGAFLVLNQGSLPVATVTIPRALRGKQAEETAAATGKKKK